jgi:hypothetical protein
MGQGHFIRLAVLAAWHAFQNQQAIMRKKGVGVIV